MASSWAMIGTVAAMQQLAGNEKWCILCEALCGFFACYCFTYKRNGVQCNSYHAVVVLSICPASPHPLRS